MNNQGILLVIVPAIAVCAGAAIDLMRVRLQHERLQYRLEQLEAAKPIQIDAAMFAAVIAEIERLTEKLRLTVK